jgi:hypothetical protein
LIKIPQYAVPLPMFGLGYAEHFASNCSSRILVQSSRPFFDALR